MTNARTARVILDDATPGRERLLRYQAPLRVICASAADAVPGALGAIQRALDCGHHVAGYFSYELGHALEPRLRRRLGDTRPLLWFGVFDRVEEISGEAAKVSLKGETNGRAYAGPLRHTWDREAYRRRFEDAREWIAAGDIYQVNLTFRSRFPFLGDALALYCALRETSRAAHGAFIDDGTQSILSLSPELFFDLAPDGRITTRPMKGTAARAGDTALDLAVRAGLQASVKDRAENLMIVDLLRNDLSRIAEPASVAVPSLFAVETYPTLHQLVSTVTARVRKGTVVEEVVRALFPCGSVTGAPKIRAMEIIDDLESSPRGIYCGAVGSFAPDGSARFNVAIRTATIAAGQGELGIGSAVVYDSDADAEYDECLLKARYFDCVREPVSLIETMAFLPANGFVRLPLHLARMAKSAKMLGIGFDSAEAQAALQNCVRDAMEPQRVRLVLDESGTFACTSVPLPASPRRWTYAISDKRVTSTDALARLKTSWRSALDDEAARLAVLCGADEALFLNERGEVAEGSRTNVFVWRGERLLTPPLECGVLDGCLRRELIDLGKCAERRLMPNDLETADAVYLGNSLRGLVPALSVRQTEEVPG